MLTIVIAGCTTLLSWFAKHEMPMFLTFRPVVESTRSVSCVDCARCAHGEIHFVPLGWQPPQNEDLSSTVTAGGRQEVATMQARVCPTWHGSTARTAKRTKTLSTAHLAVETSQDDRPSAPACIAADRVLQKPDWRSGDWVIKPPPLKQPLAHAYLLAFAEADG